jgi:hypothetical protein
MLTKDAKFTFDVKYKISMAKAAFNKNNTMFTFQIDLGLRKKLATFGA